MSQNWMRLSCFIAVILIVNGCQRSSAVSDDDSETLTDSVLLDSNTTDESSDLIDTVTSNEKETESVMDTESASAVETGTEDTSTIADTETDSAIIVETDDTATQEGSETDNLILGSWIVSSLTLDGEDKPILSEYAGTWEEAGETYAKNVISFQERPDWDDLYVYVIGECNAEPYVGGAAVENLDDIELINVRWAPIPGEFVQECPDDCSQWKDDYMTALNSASTYEIDDAELVLLNDDKTNLIRFKRCSLIYD